MARRFLFFSLFSEGAFRTMKLHVRVSFLLLGLALLADTAVCADPSANPTGNLDLDCFIEMARGTCGCMGSYRRSLLMISFVRLGKSWLHNGVGCPAVCDRLGSNPVIRPHI